MTSLERNRVESRIPELDGIRGMAILMVLCYHSLEFPQHGWFTNTANAIVSFGWSGVDLFFVLSGFLLGGILIDHRYAPNYFRTFYIRRFCRILPLYLVWLALYYSVQSFLGYSPFHHFSRWGYIFFLQNFYRTAINDFDALWMGHTWSLALEEQFYLLLPATLWFLIPRKPARVLVALILAVPLLRIFLFLFHPEFFIRVLLPCRADSLLLGVLCAWIIRQKPARDWLANNVKAVHVLALFLSFGMIYLMSLGYKSEALHVIDSFEMTSYGFTLVALFYACLLLIATIDKTSLIARVLRTRILRHFGFISYGIYVIHPGVRGLMVEFMSRLGGRELSVLSQNLISIPAFLVTWLLTTLSWRFFEKPIVQWGHSFRYGLSKISQQAVATDPIALELPQNANQSE